jgi:hypothetical protein
MVLAMTLVVVWTSHACGDATGEGRIRRLMGQQVPPADPHRSRIDKTRGGDP